MNSLDNFTVLLLDWNQRINLIGRATEKHVVARHIDDSAQLVPMLPGKGILVDLGSGAGFPGLIIALKTSLNVHLIESDKRKASFLKEAIRVTGANAVVHNQRIETVRHLKADIVTARACASLQQLLEWSEPFLHSNSICLFPKGRNYDTELSQLSGWDFTLTTIPSQTDPHSVILQLQHVRRAP